MLSAAFQSGVVWIGVSVIAPMAHAGITYQSQTRFIAANAYASGGGNASQTVNAPDFGVFNRAVNVEAVGPYSGFGSASQNSILGSASIVASGRWGGQGHVVGFPAGGGGTSSFSVDFTLNEVSSYTLTASGLAYFQSTFSFISTDAGTLHLTTQGQYSGVLQPGTYRLAGFMTGSASFPASGDEFSINLSVPAPGSGVLLMVGCAASFCGDRRLQRCERATSNCV